MVVPLMSNVAGLVVKKMEELDKGLNETVPFVKT